jgi:hypothetical protein
MYMRQKPAHIQLMSAGYAHLFGVLFHIKLTKKILIFFYKNR